MRLGDSLSVGLATMDGGAMARELARFPVWSFVGSVPSPSGGHEAHGGWRINQIAKQIDGWMASSAPTDVSLMIGTNDALSMETPAAALAELRALVVKIAKTARVTLATIPPITMSASKWQPWQVAYNAGIVELVTELRSKGVPVVLADVDKAIIASEHLAPDAVHLNAKGYAVMGATMGRAMAQLGTTSPVTSSSSSSSSSGVVVALLAVLAWYLLKGK
jgi:hypothetical protein